MACRCSKCGRPVVCGDRYCNECFLEECCKTDAEKNLFLGGRFYGEKPEKKNDERT